MQEKTGLFLCECGGNISKDIDLSGINNFFSSDNSVFVSNTNSLWCSEAGRAELKKQIMENNLTHIVIAACSPKQHEATFKKVMAEAGLNPFMMQMANIREHTAWVTESGKAATEKALSLIKAAIARVKLHEPIEEAEIDCVSDFAVIGAGISGLTAALTLAQKGRKVYLLEREPWIGGHVASSEELFPRLECAPCMAEPLMAKVLENENIKLITHADIKEVNGFFGRFEITVKQKQRFVDAEKCIGCGACYEVCPVKISNKYNAGLSERGAIYTAYAGALPNVPVIDSGKCLKLQGSECNKCAEACVFNAIDFTQEERTEVISCGAIVAATGFNMYDVKKVRNFSADKPNILDSYAFERMLAANGPTNGQIIKADGKHPASVVFVHCAGSRDKRYNEHCSGFCCANTVKQAHMVKTKLPSASVTEIFSEMCTYGSGYQKFIREKTEGITLIRAKNTNDIMILPEGLRGSEYAVDYGYGSVNADMIVLAAAAVPDSGAQALAETLGIQTREDGFFAPDHAALYPSDSTLKGIFIAGCAAGPSDIPSSVLSAQAAAGRALNQIVPGEKIKLESTIAVTDKNKCTGCGICVQLCPYSAIKYISEENVSEVNPVLCRGCGACVAACPSQAISNRHFKREQIMAEIKGILA